MFLPLIKLDKMSRIDPETDAELEMEEEIDEKHESEKVKEKGEEKEMEMLEKYNEELEYLEGE